MEVARRRLTMIAPVDLSTSYLIGCPSVGISMTTLKSSGGFSPGLIWLKSMIDRTFEVMAGIIALPGLPRRDGMPQTNRIALSMPGNRAHDSVGRQARKSGFRIPSTLSTLDHGHEHTRAPFPTLEPVFGPDGSDGGTVAGACSRIARARRGVAACRRRTGGGRIDHRSPARRRHAGGHGAHAQHWAFRDSRGQPGARSVAADGRRRGADSPAARAARRPARGHRRQPGRASALLLRRYLARPRRRRG